MNTYSLLRKTHLYVGLAVLTFVVMYFVSGYLMIHPDWFPNHKPMKNTRTESFVYNGPREPAAYSHYVKETLGLRGKSTRQRQLKDGSWEFRYTRPGSVYEALVPPAEDSVRITTQVESPVETMVGFHRLHGYGGGMLYSLWSLLYDLASLSLILFAFTGIYLWYKLTKKRLLGWIFLAVSYGYAAVTLLYLMSAP